MLIFFFLNPQSVRKEEKNECVNVQDSSYPVHCLSYFFYTIKKYTCISLFSTARSSEKELSFGINKVLFPFSPHLIHHHHFSSIQYAFIKKKKKIHVCARVGDQSVGERRDIRKEKGRWLRNQAEKTVRQPTNNPHTYLPPWCR